MQSIHCDPPTKRVKELNKWIDDELIIENRKLIAENTKLKQQIKNYEDEIQRLQYELSLKN